jgi:hypothetical protein
MVIDARHMSDLLDVRSYRGGNVDSDHYLVIARMRARISNIKENGEKGQGNSAYPSYEMRI